jgi:hypothetical protein
VIVLVIIMDINLTNIPPQGQGAFPIPLRYPSLRQSLASYLAEVIPFFWGGSLFRLRQSGEIIYRCRIKEESSPDFEGFLAILLKKNASKSLQVPEASLPALFFELRIEQPGWLTLRLSDEQLSRWLTYLWQSAELSPNPSPHPIPHFVDGVQDDFPLQYAHARCWSVIRLVTSDRASFEPSLQFDAPTRSLIQQLVEFVDHQACPQRATLILIGRLLGHAALEYLGSETWRAAMASSEQGRLGLVILVQQSLQWLLEVRCGVIARREL